MAFMNCSTGQAGRMRVSLRNNKTDVALSQELAAAVAAKFTGGVAVYWDPESKIIAIGAGTAELRGTGNPRSKQLVIEASALYKHEGIPGSGSFAANWSDELGMFVTEPL